MEFEDRNPRPEEESKSLPVVVLFVLIGIVCLLLYAGWYMMSDNASDASELAKDDLPKSSSIKDSILVDSADTEPVIVDKEAEAKAKKDEAKIAKSAEKEEVVEKAQEKKVEKPVEKIAEKPETTNTGQTTTVTVKDGQTFLGIANKFNMSFSALKNANKDVNPDALVVGKTKITIPIKAVHTVGPGDILRVVGEKYNVSVDEIMAANGKTKNFAARGEKLIIPNPKKK
jgi:LysM repeat protein